VSPQSQLDLQTVKRIAEFTHADTIVFGQYEKIGGADYASTHDADLANDRDITLKTDAPNEQQLLSSLDQIR